VAVESARIEELRRRIGSDPASIAFAHLAEEYRRAGRFEDAIATCRTGLARQPTYVSARVTLGRALVESAQYAEARSEFEHALRLAPENLAAIRALAALHERFDESAASIAVGASTPADKAAAKAPDSPRESPADAEPIAARSALEGLEAFLSAIQKTRHDPQNSRNPPAA
jgi:tetratricopeptide (TPR) repeat protein